MTMRVVSSESQPDSDTAPRSFAPGAPVSPGPLPADLSEILERGEALIWWNQKTQINWVAPLVTLVGCMMLLASITMLAPTFWARSPLEFWGPVAAMTVPAVFLLVREYLGRGQWMVTQRRFVAIDFRGYVQTLPFRSIREVHRDLWTGGVRLVGAEKSLRIAPRISKQARSAMKTQTRTKILGSGDKKPVDHVGGWF